jgi:hypothetical protein
MFKRTDMTQAHLDYLAGNASGQSPIGREEKRLAASGQEHPIFNSIDALTDGIFRGFLQSSFVVSGYALYNGAYGSVFGEKEQILKQCTANLAKYYGSKVLSGKGVWEALSSLGKSGKEAIEFLGGPEQQFNCAAFNFGYAVYDTVNAHPYIATAGLVLMTAISVLMVQRSLEQGEAEARKELAQKLANKFEKIADKLSENSGEVKETAQKIIDNRKKIRSEIENLKVLDHATIKSIVAPVMAAANKAVA